MNVIKKKFLRFISPFSTKAQIELEFDSLFESEYERIRYEMKARNKRRLQLFEEAQKKEQEAKKNIKKGE